MNKLWLSELLNDAAFPLLVLALAVSQITLGSHKKPNLVHHSTQPAELRLDDRLPKTGGKYGSSNASESPVSNKEWLQH
jgi:hypothetical protein